MHKTLHCFEGTELEVEVPFSHMTRDDANLFYVTMNSLLSYANAKLGVVKQRRVVIDGWKHDERSLGCIVGERLWERPDLVARFVDENPDGLPKACLETASLWRDAVHDLFICVQADADCALYLCGGRLFCVGAMERGADELVHSLPSLVVLTLLPFKGGVVTDGKVMHVSDTPTPFCLPYLGSSCAQAAQRSVIATAGELAAVCRNPYRDSQMTPQVQELVDQSLERLRKRALAA